MEESEISFLNETVLVPEDIDDTVCAICWAEFLDAEDLKTHVTQVHLTERRRLRYCEICSKIFPDIEKCMAHYLFVHFPKLKCCKHCFRLFPDIASKMLHEKKHKFRCKKEIFCSQCNECFNDKIYLERHEFSAHRLNGDGVIINHGFSVLSSLLNMNVRRFLMGYNEDLIYICATCQYTSYNMTSYIDHLQESSCKALSCEMCLNVYHNRNNLIRHFDSKQHGKHNIVECPKCHVMYTKTALNVHEKTCSLLKCLECNMMFNTVNEITNHRIDKHEECAFVNTCRFCNKQIIGDNMMRKHVDRVHKSSLHLYKYKCVYCDIIYKHPKLLFGHFFSSHRDIEPYTCMICNEKFRVRKKFTLHVQKVHKNIGFLEYNDKYHVSFVAEKTAKAFVPRPLYEDFYRSPPLIQKDDECPKKETKNPQKDKDQSSNEVTVIQDDPKNSVDESEPVVVQLDRSKEIRKIKRKRAKLLNHDNNESSDSDTPLVKLRKVRSYGSYTTHWNSTKNKKIKQVLNRFRCKKCNKNCYTLQNYRHHMSLHEKDMYKKCIKCRARFKNEGDLKKHVEQKHSNSILTDTLKKVLERRKLESDKPEQTKPNQITKKRFKVAMKKVVPDDTEPAVVKEVLQANKVSVKNFIENFTPDVNTDTVKIKDCVTMGLSTEVRPQKILVHKCDMKELSFTGLKKPVKAGSNDVKENYQVTMKIVNVGNVGRANLNYGTKRYNVDVDHSYCEEQNYKTEDINQGYDDDSYQTHEDYSQLQYIPEVAQEVMLGTDEVKLQKTVIVPNVPKAYKSIRIGTLQPHAPYYKIVKLDDIIANQAEPEKPKEQNVCLPDGTQLVAVNPLAHLIGKEGINRKMPKRYYHPKQKDIKDAIHKFLNGKPKNRKRKLLKASD